ncbi:MAG: tRNA uridine-5-carboxymethylaminomethyl(34) synthesis GTPase MnmE [Desulfobacteraceae bacterium]|nr:MAG: tRNA uridine-5-carboxymethylaminomethyl(34) synthesis GTPase MnmE [Desulfobacteraceae bacterium]
MVLTIPGNSFIKTDSSCSRAIIESGEDTIAAIGTAVGRAGIGIIRISGKNSSGITRRLFQPAKLKGHEKRSLQPFVFIPHHLHHGYINDPGNNSLIDEVLLAFMPAPHSYTREDVVEIQSHGGAAVLNRLLALVLQGGARLAEPGEFTRRAFINGRIDLTQAEAVADIINANSESALRLAAEQLGGSLKRRIEGILSALTDLAAEMEALIEFADEIEPATGDEHFGPALLDIICPLEELVGTYDSGRMLRDGLRITIAGRPNVGKSSLLNRLIGDDKAIVTPFPGTTRDPVEAGAVYNGIAMLFSDTAGIRVSADPVEAIGICKSKETISRADLVLFLIDAAEPESDGDIDVFECGRDIPMVLVVNKIDLVDNARNIKIPDRFRHLPAVFVCALDGTGIDAVKAQIFKLCIGDKPICAKEVAVPDIRHKLCLEAALNDLRHALTGLKAGVSEDLIHLDLQHAGRTLREITGECTAPDLLDRIFERFCIGK